MSGARTTFLLNAERVDTSAPRGLAVLDFIRSRHGLSGTKEGCKEGECGACMVLVGELVGDRVAYAPVPSCLLALGELDGKHLVTIEGLALPDRLSPVERALVDEGAVQCGFCIPGIVVSLTHAWIDRAGALDAAATKLALSGHLCRCTGYASQVRAGVAVGTAGSLEPHALPPCFDRIAARLGRLRAERGARPAAAGPRVAGGTDLYVERGADLAASHVDLLRERPGLDRIERIEGGLSLGALVTFEQLAHDPELRRVVPQIERFLFPVASLQLRLRATLGGNVAHASPIGDMTVLLLALDATVVARGPAGERRVPLARFYRGYKQIDLRPGEIVAAFEVAAPGGDVRVHFEKVAKRRCLDIASVNTAIRVALDDGVVRSCHLAMGGVAPIPARFDRSAACLLGHPVGEERVRAVLDALEDEIAPIDDVRGSALYKRLLARRLVVAHFATLFPQAVRVEAFL